MVLVRAPLREGVSPNAAFAESPSPPPSDPYAALVEHARERIGLVIDTKYQLLELIGVGTTGSVYRAQNRWAGRLCAVKLFHYQGNNEKDVLRRFVREAQAIHRVQRNGRLHPHVVDAIDVGRDSQHECFFVVQELLRGETLASYLDRIPTHRLSLHNTLRIMNPVLDAIACAHEGGVVHRDLKPDNIFLMRGGDEGIFPKVLDFGIAQVAEERVTPVTDLMGTPQYMPPEAFGGAGQVDARADVWALGVILYEMMTGSCPFAAEGDDPMASMELVTHRTPPSLAALGATSPAVWNVVRRAMMKAPAQRYGTARELLDALDASLRPVRVLRVTQGMSSEAARRALHDPGLHSKIPPSLGTPAPVNDAHRSLRPGTIKAGNSLTPPPSADGRKGTVWPMPINEVPEGLDVDFTGDPSKHWWSVQINSTGHSCEQILEILQLPELCNLVELHVSGCALGDSGVLALTESPLLRNVSALSLRRVGLTARGAMAIAAAQSLANVLKLDLEQNPLGTDGARTVLSGRYLQNLRSLNLVLTDLDASIVDALIDTPKVSALQRLDLSQNLLGDDGAYMLAAFEGFSSELWLGLARNRFTPAAIERLVSALGPRVRKLVI